MVVETWLLNGCMVHQHQMQFYNYSLASAYDHANCQNAHASNGLNYTDMCNLQTCNNQPAEEDNEDLFVELS